MHTKMKAVLKIGSLIKSQSRRADQNTDANEDQAGPKSSFRSTVFQSMSKMKGFDNAEEVKQIKIIAKAAVQADQNYNRQKLVAESAQQAWVLWGFQASTRHVASEEMPSLWIFCLPLSKRPFLGRPCRSPVRV